LRRRLWLGVAFLLMCAGPVCAQDDTDGPYSQAEIEQLRDSAPVPMDRMRVFESILTTRERDIAALVAKPHRPGYAEEMHDELEQFAQIIDELNDNLDEYSKNHRDVRKELPKLLKESERWGTVLRSPPEDEEYSIVKKIALDNLKDMHDLAAEMQTDLEAYFKAHPEAVKAEKDRLARREY
jgi:septal ring factor EnvC (AmiA/AmiB activator)